MKWMGRPQCRPICNLYAANIAILLFEARDRLGGRILRGQILSKFNAIRS
jgi:hypothetical protein